MQRAHAHHSTSWRALFNFNDLSPKVQRHLRNVYALLGASVLSATLGTWFSIWAQIGTSVAMLGLLLSFGLVIYIAASSPDRGANQSRYRIAAMLTFAFLDGCWISPLVNLAIKVDPSLVLVALGATVMIFASFTGAALFSRRRSFLFLGGILGSAISQLLLLGVLTYFIRALGPLYFNLQLYGGLVLFSAFIIYDTQLIVEKADSGDLDQVRHTLDLFIDLVGIFVRILIIILKNSRDKKRDDHK